jgi:hypothetical protein
VENRARVASVGVTHPKPSGKFSTHKSTQMGTKRKEKGQQSLESKLLAFGCVT